MRWSYSGRECSQGQGKFSSFGTFAQFPDTAIWKPIDIKVTVVNPLSATRRLGGQRLSGYICEGF